MSAHDPNRQPNLDDLTLLTDLADGALEEPSAEWLAAHPEAARQIAVARQVSLMMLELRGATLTVPPDFEARLLARIREDSTLLNLLEMSLDGFGHTLQEIISLLLNLIFPPQLASA